MINFWNFIIDVDNYFNEINSKYGSSTAIHYNSELRDEAEILKFKQFKENNFILLVVCGTTLEECDIPNKYSQNFA